MKITTLYRIFYCVVFVLAFTANTKSQTTVSYWKDSKEKFATSPSSSIVDKYRSVQLDLPLLKALLNGAIDETLPNAFSNGTVISLPMPDGSFSKFSVAVSTLMPKQLMDNFPMIRAFTAKGIDDPTAIAKLDYTQWGFHAMILSAEGMVFIDPAVLGNTSDYISFYKKDSHRAQSYICETMDELESQRSIPQNPNLILLSSGATLKTYRLAVACTGEYAAFYGGTVSGALSGIVTSVNRVSGVYQNELAVRLTLIANNNLIVYTNSGTDPYTNGSGSTMLGENQTNCDGVIGSANYDVGHVFSTGGGGVASLRVPCVSGSKARGVTGQTSPIGDSFDIDYVAHEMGHQFGGNHTFNSATGSCTSNRASTAAYEPGSGTTIMAYAGICGTDNIQPHSDAIFHTKSFDEIQAFITTGSGNSCPVQTATGNTPPVVPVGTNYTIPLNTPFVLRGTASDINGDALTYLWEEYDLGPAGAPNSPSGNAPIFRDWVPVTDTFRVCPRMEDLVRNVQTLGEILPTYARSLVFRFTVRDNRIGGGGVTHNNTPVTLTVTNTTTPFKVTVPNTAVTWAGGSTQTVTWDVSSTNIAPISCANVKIMLSVDSGYTYPYTLLASTTNDGTEAVTIPNIASTKARVKVEAIGNIFFDISNVNFTITSSGTLSSITTSALTSNNICAGSNVNVSFTTNAPATAGNIFTAQLSDALGSFASPVSIGTLTSTNAGTIAATIPGGTAVGSAYRIRVVSSSPVVTGTDNGSNITIAAAIGSPGTITGLTSVCQGQAGVIYSVPAIANATGYTWTLPAGASITSGSNTNSITVTFSGSASSGNVTVLGTNIGCGNGPVSSPLAVTVNPNAAASVSITANPGNTICSGTNVTFTAVPTNGGTTPSYQWKLGAANVGTNSATYSNNALANGNSVTCVMTSNATCATGNPATSNAITMTVNPNVAASVSITANPGNTICSGTNVTFTAVPTNGGTTPFYQWKLGAANVGTNSSTYSNNALANGNSVTCEMTSNATCATGNPATSNAITMGVTASVSISSILPSTGGPGMNVVISGAGFTGASSVKFNGISASFTVDNGGQITATVPVGASTGLISVTSGCGTGNSPVNFTFTGLVTLNLKLFLEGYYQPGSASGGLMDNGGIGGLLKVLGYSANVSDVDTVYVSAMNSITHTEVDRKAGILKTNGTVSVTFSASVLAGTTYFIKVNHRNALETWSSAAVLLTSLYDFTSLQNKAYGNNMIQTYDAIGWAFYSGDISNAGTGAVGVQDGVIESQDYSDLENAIALSLTGYVYEDITGDGVVESSDYSIMQNNTYYSRSLIRP